MTMEMMKRVEELTEHAHEERFSERGGVQVIEGEGLVFVFNNNPYANFARLRDRELARFRSWLEANGFDEVGFATYPKPPAEQAGYSFGMLIRCPEDRADDVAVVLVAIARDSMADMTESDQKAN